MRKALMCLLLVVMAHPSVARCEDDVEVEIAQTKKCEITDHTDPYSMMFPDRDLNEFCADVEETSVQAKVEVYSAEETE